MRKLKYCLGIGVVLSLTGLLPGLPWSQSNVEAWKTDLKTNQQTKSAVEQIQTGKSQQGKTDSQPAGKVPKVVSVSNNYGKPYDTIVIKGEGFGVSTKKVAVVLTGLPPHDQQEAKAFVINCKADQIIIRLPQLDPGNYVLAVQTDFGKSEQLSFSIVSGPQINTISAEMTAPGSVLQIYGSGFTFPGLKVQMVNGGISWNLSTSNVEDKKLTVLIPMEAIPGRYLLRVMTDAGQSVDKVITVGAAPHINNFMPQSVEPEKTFYIYGKYLSLGTMPTVKFDNTEAKVLSYTATKVLVQVPKVAAGEYKVILNNGYSNSEQIVFKVK